MSANELSAERLVSELKRVVRESEELIHATTDVVGEKAREVRERLSETLEAAKRTCCQLEERTIERAKATDKVIREHPYQSIGATFGLGLLIGVLVTRK